MANERETCGAAINPGLVACSYCEARGFSARSIRTPVENAVKKR